MITALMVDSIVNIAAYQFAELNQLASLRSQLRELTLKHELRGTILLSAEGINVFVAGERIGVDALLHFIRMIPALANLNVKESYSSYVPFSRMLVKIKKEIIAFGIDEVDPRRYSSRRLPATELKRWLDEGRPITLLDTRNDFEVQTGTFKNAIAIGVDDFRDFPAAVGELPDELRNQPIVTFCTGGIRCEKAAPYLEQHGFTDVYQLDGGILKYFEECGSAHYTGDCFVFDKRVALNAQLRESGLAQCFKCLAILTPADQDRPEYVPGKSCHECFVSDVENYKKLIEVRKRKLHGITSPLPGSVAYENVRPISVPLRCDGMELLEFLEAMRTHLSQEQWEAASQEGRLICRGDAVHPGRVMRAGERVLHKMPGTVEPDVATDIRIIHEDDAIVVVDKPAPLPIHPCGRFNRNSLVYLLNEVYQPLKLRPAHRLDADTSGVVLFSKTGTTAAKIQPQFDQGLIAKRYLAVVWGHPEHENFECNAAISSEPGPDGIRVVDARGLASRTQFRLIEKYEDGTALIQAVPLTGRTNQIRIHLWSLGFPILGDPMYLREGRLGTNRTLLVGEPRMMLHSASIGFLHPASSERVSYSSARFANLNPELAKC